MHASRFKLIAAVHLLLIQEHQVLLLRRHNTGYEDGKYSVIAGHLDGDEDVKSAAVREAREEAGIHIDPADVEVVGVMHRRSLSPRAEDERVDFFVQVARWTGEIANAEPQKCDELAWFPLDDLPREVIPYVRHALERHKEHDQHGAWFESYGWEQAV
ncbi:MAG: NUDIX domain-containing protein [Ktedonobacterales bacterium]